MSDQPKADDPEIAERVREGCLAAAIAAYEEASMSGLCPEGAWECALDAMRSLDLKTLSSTPPAPPRTR